MGDVRGGLTCTVNSVICGPISSEIAIYNRASRNKSVTKKEVQSPFALIFINPFFILLTMTKKVLLLCRFPAGPEKIPLFPLKQII